MGTYQCSCNATFVSDGAGGCRCPTGYLLQNNTCISKFLSTCMRDARTHACTLARSHTLTRIYVPHAHICTLHAHVCTPTRTRNHTQHARMHGWHGERRTDRPDGRKRMKPSEPPTTRKQKRRERRGGAAGQKQKRKKRLVGRRYDPNA